jgi:hypothetical protein
MAKNLPLINTDAYLRRLFIMMGFAAAREVVRAGGTDLSSYPWFEG